ncbi:nitrilase-related carbon-nitrogen hydrolase [Thioclava sp. FR2]|uniref:nitrilase-related carbon-nitrogen hydrolase n=1 Tax=Thioclava sp. FR2 TaxID=3445780 RepID=UPI003EBC3922
MRLALWQGKSPAADLEEATQEVERATAAAAMMGADVVVFPEIWMQGYNQPDLLARLLTRDNPVFDRLEKAACQSGCSIVVGYAEDAEGRSYNSALCLFPDGRPRMNYRKLQLYGEREKALYQPGDAYVQFTIAGRSAAMLICYDIEFAPHVAKLAGLGVEIILVPTANMHPFTHVVRHTVPAMAANHGVTIVYANYCGTEGDLSYVGGSLIAGPHGEILAQAGESGPCLLVAEVPERDALRLSTQAQDLRTI